MAYVGKISRKVKQPWLWLTSNENLMKLRTRHSCLPLTGEIVEFIWMGKWLGNWASALNWQLHSILLNDNVQIIWSKWNAHCINKKSAPFWSRLAWEQFCCLTNWVKIGGLPGSLCYFTHTFRWFQIRILVLFLLVGWHTKFNLFFSFWIWRLISLAD